MSTPEKKTAFDWLQRQHRQLSDWHLTLWHYAEPSWREYKSSALYGEILRAAGFAVEMGSAGMPTAFCATWGDGGPTLAAYAEYDAVPGQSQAPVPFRQPREGFHRAAAGHTDPHSGLGIGALAGVLAAKHCFETHGIKARLKFFGEPAEKMCGSKPIHAANGYYDGLDAAISFHPTSLPATSNSVIWDTHCGCYWSKIYTFECPSPELWGSAEARAGGNNPHTTARAPGAIDAVCLLYTAVKYMKEAMLPHRGTWTLNEFILSAGQATADNYAPSFGQIQFAWRCPDIEMARKIGEVIERNAVHVAAMTHCVMRSDWVTKTRPGLANHALARITYRNMMLAGPPVFDEVAKQFAREIQQNLGLAPMAEPFVSDICELHDPEEAEAKIRQLLPPWQRNYTADDYVEYTWHCPTVRLYIGRAMLRAPEAGYVYPEWTRNAMGGFAPTIDPMWSAAGRVVAATLIDLALNPDELARCQAEFRARTGGGIGGSKWLAPLLPKGFAAPVDFRWPEYVRTARGEEWSIPNHPAFMAAL